LDPEIGGLIQATGEDSLGLRAPEAENVPANQAAGDGYDHQGHRLLLRAHADINSVVEIVDIQEKLTLISIKTRNF